MSIRVLVFTRRVSHQSFRVDHDVRVKSMGLKCSVHGADSESKKSRVHVNF